MFNIFYDEHLPCMACPDDLVMLHASPPCIVVGSSAGAIDTLAAIFGTEPHVLSYPIVFNRCHRHTSIPNFHTVEHHKSSALRTV
jgi:hypothetical protein